MVDMAGTGGTSPIDYQALGSCRTPLLIGVRHHSAALARALPELLDAFAPAAVLIELPEDMSPWLKYLADPETVAPVALSAAGGDGGLFFYPLADFSPELIAIRWAFQHDVPVIPCDLAVAAKQSAVCLAPGPPPDGTPPSDGPDEQQGNAEMEACVPRRHTESDRDAGVLHQLLRRTGARDTGQLWERLVETPAVAQRAEAVRQAALLFGWAVRKSNAQTDPHNLVREAVMRRAVGQAPAHSVAVVGAFHAPALLPDMLLAHQDADSQLLASLAYDDAPPAISLVPYAFSQLDERSGYPAGIRDPLWHQRVSQARSTEEIDQLSVTVATDICRHMRAAGHVAGTPDAAEIARMVRDWRGCEIYPSGDVVNCWNRCRAAWCRASYSVGGVPWRRRPKRCWWETSEDAWCPACRSVGWLFIWNNCSAASDCPAPRAKGKSLANCGWMYCATLAIEREPWCCVS